MTRRGRRLAVLALLACLTAALAIEAFGAGDISHVAAVGWWSKRPAAQPTPGNGSFEVASGIDGNESVAAFRILITGTVTQATLVVSEASNPLSFMPKLQVCRTETPWVLTTNPGIWSDAPAPSCDNGAVPLTRDAKGTWTGDITAMLVGPRSEVSVMVVPAPDSTLPIPPTFFVDFAAPRVDAAGTSDVLSTTTVLPATSPPPTTARLVVPAAPAGSGSSGSRSSAPTTAVPTTVAAAPAPVAAGSTPARIAVQAVPRKPKPWGRLVWMVPLSALLAFGYTAGRKELIERGVVST